MTIDLDALHQELRELDDAELLLRRSQGDRYIPEAQAAIAQELARRGALVPPVPSSPIDPASLRPSHRPHRPLAKVMVGLLALVAANALLGLTKANPVLHMVATVLVVALAVHFLWFRPTALKLKLSDETPEARQTKREQARNRIGKEGYSELMFAAADGDANHVRAMLQYGAIIDGQDGGGFSALMYAAASGHTQVVDLLLQSGASPSLRSSSGRTAADYAAAGWHLELERKLWERLLAVATTGSSHSTA